MQLRLLSLNVWGLPWPASRIPNARMQMVASELPELALDAAAFQEVWTAEGREILARGGERAGLRHVWQRNTTVENSGLLVLSRWPILESRFTRFALGGLPQRLDHMDYYGGKGFAQCVLETPAGELELFATHLQAGYGRLGYADPYLGHRVGQMIELALAVAKTDRPVVVLGDLNARPNRDEMSVLLGATGLIDVAVAIGRETPTQVPYSAYGDSGALPGKRIDYALARPGVARGIRAVDMRRTFDREFVLRGQRASFSDHRGVLAELDLSGPGQPLPAPVRHTLERARRALKRGRVLAKQRRAEQRVAGASAALLAAGSGATAYYTRRTWLRRVGFGIAALSALPAAVWIGLAEGYTPRELESYRTIDAKLDQLRRLVDARGG